MEIWTTFTPRKVCWELTKVKSDGKSSSSDWQKNIPLISESLKKLKQIGISGIRLVIYPSEITTEGKKFDFYAVDKMLDLCSLQKIKVDLCIGPFQYPNYPGIYLPQKLLKRLDKSIRHVDDDKKLKDYGFRFVNQQIKRYGKDKRINGFHLGNEWPDAQRIEGREDKKIKISHEFMTDTVNILKSNTEKPILFNTNITSRNKNKLNKAFKDMFEILEKQAWLGFDIYPSQKGFLQKVQDTYIDYVSEFNTVKNLFPRCNLYFAEVEAQPWGGGQSWWSMIQSEEDPDEKILNYSNNSLEKTWIRYVRGTNTEKVMLWGSDFWLSADAMRVIWPINQIKILL